MGQGYRQTGKQEPPVTEANVGPRVVWSPETGESILDLGGEQINVDAAAEAAVELAWVTEGARVKRMMAAHDRLVAADQEIASP